MKIPGEAQILIKEVRVAKPVGTRRGGVTVGERRWGDEDIFRAFQADARAYFLKDIKGQALIAAIRAVRAGQRPVPPKVAARLAERLPRSELSHREMEILELIAKGMSNEEIAGLLNISEGTVRVHASNIFAKLGCSDRAQAVSVAFQRGLIYLD